MTKSGYLFKHPQSGTYYLEYHIGGRKEGKRERKALRYEDNTPVRNKEDAEAIRDREMSLINAEDRRQAVALLKDKLERLDSDKSPTPMAQAWDRFKDSQTRSKKASPATLGNYAAYLETFKTWMQKVHPQYSNMEDIPESVASAFMAKIDKEHTNRTYNAYLQALRLIFKTACPARNPFAELRPYEQKGISEEREPFTEDELRAIRAHTAGDMASLVDLGILTGQRMGDLCLLKKSAFNTPRKENNYKHGWLTLRQRKTGKWVNVPASRMPPLNELLTRLSSNATSSEHFMPEVAAQYERHHQTISTRFQKIVDDCGIKSTEKRPDGKGLAIVRKSFHSLRHGFVTVARMCGIPDAEICSITGMSTAMLTHYSHLNPVQINAFLTATGFQVKQGQALLPGAKTTIDAEIVKALADRLNAETWQDVKAELLAITV